MWNGWEGGTWLAEKLWGGPIVSIAQMELWIPVQFCVQQNFSSAV